ncbi:upstream stimulatory factor 2 isoform X2 [Tetranychus urticae]|uniref:upstream stimulatory factor 2 isoform X2 n=1 Tax=Tetranychus urticae TaxID=32264 RepID=UPI00077B9F9B|nr:upstream stimulatory factor 2 isoform X2 [Tetranychus urticae]
METGDQVPEDPQFMADLTPDSLDAMDDGDLRKACQMVLKRDIGPITDSTRDLYKLAVKRALIGHPIVFDSNNENNPEITSENDHDLLLISPVTYRVVQVVDNTAENTAGHHMVSPISSNSGVAQTIIAQNQLVSNTSTGSASDGPFYVMMTPSQEIVTHTSLRKRTSSTSEGSRNPRDEKRRATHNEVERRRRDKINNWITKLAGIVPDCAQDRTKQGQSKGGILAKACEYINQLVKENSKLSEIIKENEILSNELDSLRLQLLDVKKENRQLKTTLQRHGLQAEES